MKGDAGVAEMNLYEAGKFYQLPKNIHKVLKNPFEFAVLTYLLQCADDNGSSFPSYKTLAQGMMSRYQAILSVKQLETAGFITIKKTPYHSNHFTVDISKLVNCIEQSTVLTSQPRRPPQSTVLTTLVNQVDPNNNHLTKTIEQKEIIEDNNFESFIKSTFKEAKI